MMDLRDRHRLQQEVGDASTGSDEDLIVVFCPPCTCRSTLPWSTGLSPSMPTPAGSALESLPRLLKTAVALHLKVER